MLKKQKLRFWHSRLTCNAVKSIDARRVLKEGHLDVD